MRRNHVFDPEKIIAMTPGHVYWLDREGVYLGCNDLQAKTAGLKSSNEIVGKRNSDLPCFANHQDIAKQLDEFNEEIMSTGIARTLEEPVLFFGTEYVYYSNKTPIKDENGKVVGLLGVSMDITDIKIKEAKLRSEKESIEVAIDQVIARLPGHIYWKNKEGVYLGCNDRQARSLRLGSRFEVIGKTDFELPWSKESAQEFRENDLEVMTTGREISVEETLEIDGKEIIVLSQKVPLRDKKNQIAGVLGVSIDVTELKDAQEKAEAAARAKSDFLATVSHELRIPLTGILGMAQLLGSENLPMGYHQQVQDIIKSGDHLLSLVNDLLDLAKLEAGKMELNIAPVDLRKLIEELATMFTFQAKQKNLELLVDYPTNASHLIMADARAIRQILLNLVSNAIKFTEKGHIVIKINYQDQTATHAIFEIKVEDTGIGIAESKKKLVFERFTQIDSSITRKYSGTGLGLALCKSFLELMDGKIELETELGKGSVFTVTFPFQLQSPAIAMSPWDVYKSKVRVLIVDDTLRGQVLYKQIASSLCQLVPGNEAFNTFLAAQKSDQRFDVIIIDQQLQSANALDLAKIIQNQTKENKPLLLLLIPKNSLNVIQIASTAGFFDTLVKPTHPTELLTSLTAAWEKWTEKNVVLPKENIEEGKMPYILLVEDDPMVQRVHTGMLVKLGCKVELAENGEKAIELSKKDFNLIFMDVGLPDLSGIEVAREIRKREDMNKENHKIIIALTGYTQDEYRKECLAAGMNDLSTKPIKANELHSLLEKWLK